MSMFCFQCQETFRNSGCTVAGVCGKKAETANMMDRLIRQLKILAQVKKPTLELGRFTAESLFLTLTNANFDLDRLGNQLAAAERLTGETSLNAPLGVESESDPDIRSLKELITYGLKGISAYAEHAAVLGFEDESVYAFIFKALAATAVTKDPDTLTQLVLETGNIAVRVMELLDQANTETFGVPEMTTVSLNAGNRPGILVSGHDLRDLLELLEQTEGTGIDVYTHGEMLPAHAYPKLKKFSHLKGNYGGAWYRQNLEFGPFNGPILMTTNCIIPVQDAYKDRIFTTGAAGWPGVPHIADRIGNKPKDFSALIELAKKSNPPDPLENGTVLCGFAHGTVLSLADKVIEAVKTGQIKRFIVMAGCDGRHKSREYYTNIAELLPNNTIILTAGCAKYRYNKLQLGEIGGVPRVLDAGQCNDSYSLALIALKLKEAFGLDDVNQLPLSFDIAWYEQKAVAVLLALLALGFRNIRLGPTLPGFLSPAIAKFIIEKFGLMGITTPEEDVAAMMNE